MLCWQGTQDAAFLSSSDRSTDCIHTEVFKEVVEADDVPVDALRARMALRADAADFAVPGVVGSGTVMFVLSRRVYSVVFFTSKRASCIAPGCRSFARRCGHAKAGRQRRAALPDMGADHRDASVVADKVKRDAPARPRFLKNEKEDEGLEKVAWDTMRAATDAVDGGLSDRQARNLLPCAGERKDGEAWTRTADWKAMFEELLHDPSGERQQDAATMGVLYRSALRRGLVKDTTKLLVEQQCGSCGRRRGAQHKLVKESAVLHTHHPTAPSLRVSDRPFLLLLGCVCFFPRVGSQWLVHGADILLFPCSFLLLHRIRSTLAAGCATARAAA